MRQAGKDVSMESIRIQTNKKITPQKTASCSSSWLSCRKRTAGCISVDKEGWAEEILESFKNLSSKKNLASKALNILWQMAVLSSVLSCILQEGRPLGL